MVRPQILIVEDEIIAGMALRTKLTDDGFADCELVSSGEEAIDRVQKKPIDLVLMDINIRGEIGGIEAARVIHMDHDIPIIFVTGYPDQEIMDRAMVAKPADYLIKPLDYNVLLESIKKALREKNHITNKP
jgi:CheY-like chemotaxis protein